MATPAPLWGVAVDCSEVVPEPEALLPGSHPDLRWVAGVLWKPSEAVRISAAAQPPQGMRLYERFAVLPSARNPRLLVPLAAKRTAGAALRQYNSAMGRPARVARAMAGLAMAIGAGQAAFRHRLHVFVAANATPESVGESVLTGHLREALGRADLHAAVSLGPARPNRKPVIHLITGRGRSWGYVKVGWNDLTRGLVREEATALRPFVARPPRSFSVPRLIHAGPWSELELLVVTPLPSRLWGGGRPEELPVTATREVALGGGIERRRLGHSSYWREARRRMADLAVTGPASVRSRVEATADRLASLHGERELAFGRWHGDWAPWNMARYGRRLFIWDWERSGGPVPVGFDVLHFAFQVAIHVRGLPPTAAAEHARGRSALALASLDVAPDALEVLLPLYLVELFLRLHDARVRGGVTEDWLYTGVLEAAERAAVG
jgi:hypothetical protein